MKRKVIEEVKSTLRDNLRKKFKGYKPETSSMPFHTRLLGKDRMALFSFIQSLNTNFGTRIFEPVAKIIAKEKFKEVKTHTRIGTRISRSSSLTINDIMENLDSATTKPNKNKEIREIRKVCQNGKMKKIKSTLVDIMLISKADDIFLIDLKTAKPNKGEFKGFKRTLLEWVALYLADNPRAKINTLISIPYNPYAPKKYSRWTIAGMLDLPNELKVAEEFWDFLGGKGTYKSLLKCFEEVGIELRPEIDKYFKKFKNGNQ